MSLNIKYLSISTPLKWKMAEFENYSQLLKNNKLAWKSDNFEMAIKSVAGKEKQFIRNIEIKKIWRAYRLIKFF